MKSLLLSDLEGYMGWAWVVSEWETMKEQQARILGECEWCIRVLLVVREKVRISIVSIVSLANGDAVDCCI